MNDQTTKATIVFTPAAVAAISEGYAEACRMAKVRDDQQDLRFRLADRVMLLASNGELDPKRLSTAAVTAVMREGTSQQPETVGPTAAAPGATGVDKFGNAP